MMGKWSDYGRDIVFYAANKYWHFKTRAYCDGKPVVHAKPFGNDQ
jgi:hypothetical protein